jgi:penicillin amidase
MGILALSGCKKGKDVQEPSEPSPLLDVEEAETWSIEGLKEPAYVLRTELDVPHIYAASLGDLGRVEGFTVARDRYFEMELLRRLTAGTLSEILGDAALDVDLEARGSGMTQVAMNIRDAVAGDAEMKEWTEGMAAGVNAYIDAVRDGELPAPTELELAGPFLGASSPAEMMASWDWQDIAFCSASFVYISSFEGGDVGATSNRAKLDTLWEGAALEEYRRGGLYSDLWDPVVPVFDISSAEDWGLTVGGQPRSKKLALKPRNSPKRAHQPMLERLAERLEHFERRLGHEYEHGWGSNVWAVAGSSASGGGALLAGDGHLALTVPNYMYQIGIDTQHLGGGDLAVIGTLIPGMPTIATGTNGKVAWSSTQLFGDITDWYSEKVLLNEKGQPSHTEFLGEWQPLTRIDESFEIKDIPLLGSEGRTETWARWKTFDGRWLASVEGADASAGSAVSEGQSLVNFMGDYVIPGDEDGDGIVTGVSFAYAGIVSGSDIFKVFMKWNTAEDVWEFREAQRGAVGFSQNVIAADSQGNIAYTGYQAVPCRDYLPKDEDGVWLEGADPRYLLDGTTYGAFEIVMTDGLVDESYSDDPYRCTVPFDAYPSSVNPSQGYLLNANNDPGNISTDNSLADDPYYIGGPWLEGYRAARIDELLADAIANGWADAAGMAEIQGDHHSMFGEQLVGVLIEAIEHAEEASTSAGTLSPSEERMVALYSSDSNRIEEVKSRLLAWADADYPAESGVETFYHSPGPEDAAHAVATTLFNAWMGTFVPKVLNDEGYPRWGHPTGDTGRTRALKLILGGRGPGNPSNLGSYNPDTEESAYFDILGTDEVETCDEVAVLSLTEALDFLESEPIEGWRGGYGTEDMNEWLWGLRHLVRFESTVADFLGEDDSLAFLVEAMSVNTDILPLADDLDWGDPRKPLPWFPRHGDHLNVDAGNSGFDRDWSYGSGPVFRMVITLDPEHPTGQNILPAGQSGVVDSKHFADQSPYWLGNETIPMRITLEDVLAGATSRESFFPE